MTVLSSIRSNFVVSASPLAAPEDLALNVDSDTEITLEWIDVAVAGYVKIERSLSELSGFEEVASVPVGDETYQDTGLDPDTEYFYRIRAFYLPSGYSAYSDIESATTDA